MLRVELARPSWKREHVALGTNTDPYQWVEGRYRLMQGIWEALRDAANPCSVLTKSPLLLRDLTLMLEIAAAHELQRVPVDPDARREGMAGNRAAHAQPARAARGGGRAQPRRDPDGRADRAADARHQRFAASRSSRCWTRATAAGATSIGGVALHLRGEVREVFMGWLGSQRPELVARYQELYRRGAYAPPEERERLARMVRRGRPTSHAGSGLRRSARGAPRTAAARGRPVLAGARAGSSDAGSRSAFVAQRDCPCRCAISAAAEPAHDGRRRSGATFRETAPARWASGATSTSPRSCSIASHHRSRHILGLRVPTPGGSLTPESANMPASRMKPGNTQETPTPVPCRSVRSAAAKPRRPNLVAW